MKNYLIILFLLFWIFNTTGYAQSDIQFGTDTTFEAGTWNIEHFPKNGQTTIDYVIQFVEEMDIDMLGLQEIESESSFNEVLTGLPGWDGFWQYYDYTGMAYIYNTDVVELLDHYQILTQYERELPRAPLVAEIRVGNDEYIVINNHYKCCGDGTLDESDLWDEEKRRYDASVLIKDYIDTHYDTDRVILLGDLNDNLLDAEDDNVFQPFFEDTENYLFADLSIAESSASNWSYPSWPSHLDHILVTNEIFSTFENGVPDVATIKLDDALSGGWNAYDEDISDHRPVALRMSVSGGVNINSMSTETNIEIYPNPSKHETNIHLPENFEASSLTLHNSNGEIVNVLEINDKKLFTLNTEQMAPGIYYIFVPGMQPTVKKLVVVE